MPSDQITWDPAVIGELAGFVAQAGATLDEVRNESVKQDARLEETFKGAGPTSYYEQKALRNKSLQQASETLAQLSSIVKKALAHTIEVDGSTKSFFTSV